MSKYLYLRALLFFVVLVFCALPALAEVDMSWVRRYNGPGNYEEWSPVIAVDDSGNVYIAGTSYTGSVTGRDYALIKYDRDGNELFVKTYNGPGNGEDWVRAMTIDSLGNVYVTGSSFGGSTTSDDYATIKYYPNGDIAWARRHNGPASLGDGARDIAVDGYGDVYVTGTSFGASSTSNDFATVMYTMDGYKLWAKGYDGGSNGDDEATSVAVDKWSNVYVAGSIFVQQLNYICATIKYYPNGDTAWVRTYWGPGIWHDDWLSDIEVDDSGNVYVTGSVWDQESFNNDCITIKYDTYGNILWARRYQGPGNSDDAGNDIALDESGNVYVAGTVTIKYDANGNQLWVASPGGDGIALDKSGNAYVAATVNRDYCTAKFSPDGHQLWIETYNGPASSDDFAKDIALDDSGNVYVTGHSQGIGTYSDFATIKYHQTPDRGDVNGDGTIDVGDVVFLINYLYKNGQAPSPPGLGDANCDGIADIGDVVYLINYLFKGGNQPGC